MNLRHALSAALAAATLATAAVAQDNTPPGGRGGPGTHWENPPGPRGGPGTSPDRTYVRDGQRYVFAARPAGYYYSPAYGYYHPEHGWWNEAGRCWRDPDWNPPGPASGPGTNWENPPGLVGGRGASPDRFGPCR